MDCPCINCITFPICRNQVIETFAIKRKEQKNNHPQYLSSYFKLREKCSLIQKYFSSEGEGIYITLEMHEIFNVYKG